MHPLHEKVDELVMAAFPKQGPEPVVVVVVRINFRAFS
jgi:hypothetical protein